MPSRNKRTEFSVVMKNVSNMRKYLFAFPLIAAMLAHNACLAGTPKEVDNSTVSQLDIHQFMGKWFEIARYDHSFERDMTNVTAEYYLLDDGKIEVINRGFKNGEPKRIVGKAKQPQPIDYPGRLKVSFFLWFYSDYYILDLDKDYQYAIIGSSSDKYLWILSRTPEMSEAQLKKILQKIVQRGYDVGKLLFVKQ